MNSSIEVSFEQIKQVVNFGINEIAYNFIEINNAGSLAMATKMDENIELMSKVLYFIVTKFSVAGVTLPASVLTAINYFINDLNDESYMQPLPMMCVR